MDRPVSTRARVPHKSGELEQLNELYCIGPADLQETRAEVQAARARFTPPKP